MFLSKDCGMNALKMVLSISIFLGWSGIYAAPLFESGKSAWSIRLSPQASEPEKFAASELQRVIAAASGVKLPIEIAQDGKENTIVIGTPQTSAGIREIAAENGLNDSSRDAIAIIRRNDTLYLGGNSPRACLFAVYDFLRNELGCRWLWPVEGEFIPVQKRYELPERISRTFRTFFHQREMTTSGQHNSPEWDLWCVRNNLNAHAHASDASVAKYGLMRNCGEHYLGIGYGDKYQNWSGKNDDFEKYPEYFASIDGKRTGGSGCWSNPDFIKLLTSRLIDIAKRNNAELYVFLGGDTRKRCQCPACMKNPDVSGRYYDFITELRKGMSAALPKLKFATVAYQEYATPPSQPVSGLEYVEYTAYRRCEVHNLDDRECLLNRDTLSALNAWREKAPVALYGYTFDFGHEGEKKGHCLYIPFHKTLANDVKFAKKLGLVRIKEEVPVKYPGNRSGGYELPKDLPRAEFMTQKQRLSSYVFARMTWDPDADYPAIVRDFCRTAYGAGGDAIADYHLEMGKAWQTLPHQCWWYKTTGILTKLWTADRIRFARNKFSAAEAAIRKMASPARERALLELGVERVAFAEWEGRYQRANENNIPVAIGQSSDFNDAVPLPFTYGKGKEQATAAQIFWNDKGLHLRVFCSESTPEALNKKTGEDVYTQNDTLEIFIDPLDGSDFRHFTVNCGGARYDSKGGDHAWNALWNSRILIGPENWTADLSFPPEAVGRKLVPGAQFLLSVTRNGRKGFADSGFPGVFHADTSGGCGALMILSEKKKPLKGAFFFPDPGVIPEKQAQLASINYYKEGLLKTGWNYSVWSTRNAMEADFRDVDLIFITNYRSKLSQEFFRDKVLPAVENGATAVIHLSGNYELLPLDKYFGDSSYGVHIPYAPKIDERSMTPYWNEALLTKLPFRMDEFYRRPASILLEFKNPEAWTILAGRNPGNGNLLPWMAARRYGKGVIVLTGDLAHIGQWNSDNIAKLLVNFAALKNQKGF